MFNQAFRLEIVDCVKEQASQFPMIAASKCDLEYQKRHNSQHDNDSLLMTH